MTWRQLGAAPRCGRACRSRTPQVGRWLNGGLEAVYGSEAIRDKMGIGRIGLDWLPTRRPREPIVIRPVPMGPRMPSSVGVGYYIRGPRLGCPPTTRPASNVGYTSGAHPRPGRMLRRPCFPQGSQSLWAREVFPLGTKRMPPWASGVCATGSGRTALELQRSRLDVCRCLLDVLVDHRRLWTATGGDGRTSRPHPLELRSCLTTARR